MQGSGCVVRRQMAGWVAFPGVRRLERAMNGQTHGGLAGETQFRRSPRRIGDARRKVYARAVGSALVPGTLIETKKLTVSAVDVVGDVHVNVSGSAGHLRWWYRIRAEARIVLRTIACAHSTERVRTQSPSRPRLPSHTALVRQSSARCSRTTARRAGWRPPETYHVCTRTPRTAHAFPGRDVYLARPGEGGGEE